jgi:transmembrane sensor
MIKGIKDKQQSARDEALVWFARLHSGEVDETERAAHAVWMEADPANRTEFARLGNIWSDLDAIGDPRTAVLPVPVVRARPTRRLFLAGGASALAASAAILAGPPDFLTSDHTTGTGELRSVNLPDGSVAHLDAGSAIALDFTDRLRSVDLLRGRALFDVVKDASRPFTVAASRGNVTALGTRFVVHRWADDVTVSVEESSVSVEVPNQLGRVVQAGQCLSYDSEQLGEVRQADIESETAWLRGKLMFEDRPLRQVLADVNRYRSGTIRVTSSRLLDMRVSGIFDIRKPDGVLDAVTSTLPVRSLQLSPYLVILYPA